MCPRPRVRRIRRHRRRVRRHRRRVRRHFRRVRRGAYWLFAPPGAVAPWRLHRRHVIIIEREAGKPIDELSEEELDELMEKLGIEKEDLTDEDEEALEEEDEDD
ncbi:MAG: hypothetical protein ACFFCO_05385 [Promethearchaeota archaeon]